MSSICLSIKLCLNGIKPWHWKVSSNWKCLLHVLYSTKYVSLLALPHYYAEQSLCICRASVCLSHSPSLQQHAAGLLLWAQPAGDIDQLLHGAQQCSVWRVNAGSATLSAYVGIITCFDAYLGAICCKLAHMLSC